MRPSLALALALPLLASCRTPGPLPPSALGDLRWELSAHCDDFVKPHKPDELPMPRVNEAAMFAYGLDDGYIMREVRLELLPDGQLWYYDNQSERPSLPPQSTPVCGRAKLSPSALEAVKQSLLDHHVCSIEHGPIPNDVGVDKIHLNLPGATCDVAFTRQDLPGNADAAAVNDLVGRLTPRCPTNLYPCKIE